MADKLEAFEGKPVITCTVKITNAGDGLSDALKVDPIELHVNQRVFFVIETEVDAVQFKRVTPAGNDMTRVHVLKTQRITAVDADDVRAYLDDAQEHVRRALAEISDDQLTIDDELAAKREAAASNGHDAEADPDSITATVEKVKRSRKKTAPTAPDPSGEA